MDQETLINNYFEGIHGTEEKAEFDRLLATDTAFKEEVEFQQKTKAAITLLNRKQLKEQLQNIETEQTASRKPRLSWIAAAAAVLVFAVLSIGIWQYQQSSDRLYMAYFQTMPNIEAPNVRGESTSDIKVKAFSFYDQEEYASAIPLFSAIYQEEKADYALLYLGVSMMETGQFEEAAKVLEQFEGADKSAYYYPIRWYTALAYLKTQQKSNSIAILKSISQDDNPFKAQAAALLEQLE